MTCKHIKWLTNTGKELKTADGIVIKVLEFCHENDEAVLSAWAKHFRNHYCSDTEIDFFRKGTSYSRSEFLNKIIFPDSSNPPGPSIRAGDLGEILVSDYLEYLLGYWVPRTRYGNKDIRNESTKGCDIIGFKLVDDGKDSMEDTLAIFEAKAQFAGNKSTSRLQDAVLGSAKDHIRNAESLHAIKRRLFDKQMFKEAEKIARFQNLEDRPYKEIYGAVALFSTNVFDVAKISKTETCQHPHRDKLSLLVIHGNDMMNLVHELYRRAADEA